MRVFSYFQTKNYATDCSVAFIISFFSRFIESVQRTTATAIIPERRQPVLTRVIQIPRVCRCRIVIHTAKSQASKTPIGLTVTILRCRTIAVSSIATASMVTTTTVAYMLRHPNVTATVATNCLPAFSTIPTTVGSVAVGIATAT